jgi:hypothetical protein
MSPDTSINNPIYRSTANAELIGDNSMKNSLCMQEPYPWNISFLQFRIPRLLPMLPFATQDKSARRPASPVIRVLDISRLIPWKYVPQIAARRIVTMMQGTESIWHASFIMQFPRQAVHQHVPALAISFQAHDSIPMGGCRALPLVTTVWTHWPMRTYRNFFPQPLMDGPHTEGSKAVAARAYFNMLWITTARVFAYLNSQKSRGNRLLLPPFPSKTVRQHPSPLAIDFDAQETKTLRMQWPMPQPATVLTVKTMRAHLRVSQKALYRSGIGTAKDRHAQPPHVESDSTRSCAPTSVEAGFRAVALGASHKYNRNQGL